MPRFPNGVKARYVITDLAGATTTWLYRSLLSGTVVANLNQPWQITGAVRSADPSVNTIFAGDGDPLVAQSNRLVYVFLDYGGVNPLECVASGVLMSPQDEADPDIGTTHFTAYDPWQYLFGRPCYADTAGTPISSEGFLFPATRGGVIVATLLKNAIESEGIGCFIDAGLDYAGTPFWTGTIEDTPVIDFRVQQGMTVGDAWNALVAAGDPSGGTGGVDIVLEPIYDQQFRPTYTSQLSVFNLAGSEKPSSPMAWGRFTRSTSTASREHDGTPGSFVNVADFHVGQGGYPVPLLGPPPSNAASVAKYQPYWSTQFFPDQTEIDPVLAMARQALILGKQGKRTFTVNPDPLRASVPFRDYTVGDRIPQLSTDHQRVGASGSQRIETIPVQINPDGVIRVNALLTTPDWRGDNTPPEPPVPPPPPEGSGAPIGLAEGQAATGFSNIDVYSLIIDTADDSAAAAALNNGVLLYSSGLDVPTGFNTGVPWATANANGWLLKDSDGNLLTEPDFPDNNIGNIGNSGYQAAWISGVLAQLADAGCYGVFIDDVIRDWNTITNTTPALYPTVASQRAAMIEFLSAVGPPIIAAGYAVCVNADAFTPGDSDSNDGTLAAAWATEIAGSGGVTIIGQEFWMESPDTNTLRTTGPNYYQHAEGWVTLPQTVQNLGCGFMGITYGDDLDHFLYPFACFLLYWDGTSAGAAIYTPPEHADPYPVTSPYLGIGTPVDPAGSNPRAYTGGTVSVDFATATGTIT